MVVTPSVTGTDGPAWLSSFLSSGGASYVDIISFHGYWSQTAEDINTLIVTYKSVMRANGVSGKPLWDTEASWTTGWTQYPTDGESQAAFLAKYYLLQWSGGVSRFYWYVYDGGIWGGLETGWEFGTPTPAATAYAEVAKCMTGAGLTKPCSSDASGSWTCGFSHPDGSIAEAVWNSRTTVTYTVPPQFTQVRDLSGNVSPAPRDLQVGNLPGLLVFSAFSAAPSVLL
jgi:hypothetical protein